MEWCMLVVHTYVVTYPVCDVVAVCAGMVCAFTFVAILARLCTSTYLLRVCSFPLHTYSKYILLLFK